jgi:hypothetical protein
MTACGLRLYGVARWMCTFLNLFPPVARSASAKQLFSRSPLSACLGADQRKRKASSTVLPLSSAAGLEPRSKLDYAEAHSRRPACVRLLLCPQLAQRDSLPSEQRAHLSLGRHSALSQLAPSPSDLRWSPSTRLPTSRSLGCRSQSHVAYARTRHGGQDDEATARAGYASHAGTGRPRSAARR